jgi:hypothetical protein
MTIEWLDNAPRFTGVNVGPITIEYEDKPYPALVFQFLRASAQDKEQMEMTPLMVLADGEKTLREFQQRLDKAITVALREVKERKKVKSPLLLVKGDIK